MSDLTLAIDAGTGSCRAVIFDGDGRPAGSGQREWQHIEEPGVPGSQVFAAGPNWELICVCVREALARAGVTGAQIAGVSSTSMREGMVVWDEAGNELWACPNVDSRAGAQAARLIESGAAERIYRTAGDWVSITAPARFLWLVEHRPELMAAAAHVGMLGDWVLTRLSGEFATDPSLGSSSGMFDLAARGWSADVIALCGVDPAIFPPVRSPGTVIGQVTSAAAAQTGLAAGTPVIAGGADTQLGLVGIGVTEPGGVTVVGGTFWQHTVLLDRPVIDPGSRLRTLCHAVDDRWMIEGIGFYSGLVMRWFRDAFCQAELERSAGARMEAYTLMDELAAASPVGANGLVGVFSNLMQADHWVQPAPALLGFDISNPGRSGRGACIRAIEESAVYVARGHLEIAREVTGHAFDRVIFTGGAARASLWPQILADALGAEVRVPEVTESTALAAALYARLGAGLDTSLPETLARVVRFARTIEPDATAHGRYEELYANWLEINRRALGMSEDGLLTPLWRAAGT
ncbi:MAG TPA: autoinducer-2 kinase [Gaiellales bacterium]